MKMMQRPQSEHDNVYLVQDLAEVDGPFESPININFRDLTKLDLPSLMWNQGDSCPNKMKITNTGHTGGWFFFLCHFFKNQSIFCW